MFTSFRPRTTMNNRDWYKISNENRVQLVGRCGVRIGTNRFCQDANRHNARFCWNHRYHLHRKCVVKNCPNKRRPGPGLLCLKHMRKSPDPRVRSTSVIPTVWCMYCKTKRAKKDKQCSSCYSEKNICKHCKGPDSKPLITRGGVCAGCPVRQRLKCAEPFCNHLKMSGYDYCRNCGEVNGKNMCSECKENVRNKNSLLCDQCNK